jgi:hypothetical protein
MFKTEFKWHGQVSDQLTRVFISQPSEQEPGPKVQDNRKMTPKSI